MWTGENAPNTLRVDAYLFEYLFYLRKKSFLKISGWVWKWPYCTCSLTFNAWSVQRSNVYRKKTLNITLHYLSYSEKETSLLFFHLEYGMDHCGWLFGRTKISGIVNVVQLKKDLCCGFKRNNKILEPYIRTPIYSSHAHQKHRLKFTSLLVLLRTAVNLPWRLDGWLATTGNLASSWSRRAFLSPCFSFLSRTPIIPNLIRLNKKFWITYCFL